MLHFACHMNHRSFCKGGGGNEGASPQLSKNCQWGLCRVFVAFKAVFGYFLKLCFPEKNCSSPCPIQTWFVALGRGWSGVGRFFYHDRHSLSFARKWNNFFDSKLSHRTLTPDCNVNSGWCPKIVGRAVNVTCMSKSKFGESGSRLKLWRRVESWVIDA